MGHSLISFLALADCPNFYVERKRATNGAYQTHTFLGTKQAAHKVNLSASLILPPNRTASGTQASRWNAEYNTSDCHYAEHAVSMSMFSDHHNMCSLHVKQQALSADKDMWISYC